MLEFAIGELEISANREALQYTDFTRKNIKDKLAKVRGELVAQAEAEMAGCKTLYAAKCLHGEMFDFGSSLYEWRNVLSDSLKWNGKKVEDSSFSTYQHSEEGMSLTHYEKSSRATRFKGNNANSVGCSKRTVVIENDLGSRVGTLGRILPLCEWEKKDVYMLQFNTKKAKAEFIKKEGFDAPMVKLSTLPKHKLNEFYTSSNSAGSDGYGKNEKHSMKVFRYDTDASENLGRYDRAKSKWWEAAEVDVENDEGVYAILDAFELEDKSGEFRQTIHPNRLKSLKEKLEKVGIDMPEIIGFKVKARAKIEDKDGWVNIWEWMRSVLKKKIEEVNLEQKYVDRQLANEVSDKNYIVSAGSKEHAKMLGKLLCNGTWKEFYSKRDKMMHKKEERVLDSIKELASDISLELNFKDIKPTHDLNALRSKLEKKYGMILHCDRWSWGWDWKPQFTESLTNYINVVDMSELTQG